MRKLSSNRMLLLALIFMLLFPLLGGLIRWHDLPPNFGVLAEFAVRQAEFSWTVFSVLGTIFILLFVFLLFPHMFGFRCAQDVNPYYLPAEQQKISLPLWFWLGTIVCLSSWSVMWGQFEWLGKIRHFMFVPLWWGFIFFLDGIVYVRNGGRSFVSLYPGLLFWCAVLSEIGWYYFEYLNFFVLKNWYYPYIELIPKPWTWLWSAITFSTVWPALFIWYQLLNTFKGMSHRYCNGPVLQPTKTTLWVYLIIGILLCVITSIAFELLFWLIWVGPMMILASACSLCSIWTPFSAIAKGNWSPVILMGLAALFNGFFWEMWNFYSQPNNPNFWHYNLPYIHRFTVFEMPILGYSGYLFFGSMCWIMFIASCKLLGIKHDPVLTDGLQRNE